MAHSLGSFQNVCSRRAICIKIHADLAILPSSTACGKPDTQMVNLLRHTLLQVKHRPRIYKKLFQHTASRQTASFDEICASSGYFFVFASSADRVCSNKDMRVLETQVYRTLCPQAVYPDSGGVPPAVARPTVVLIVRESKRLLKNNNQV